MITLSYAFIGAFILLSVLLTYVILKQLRTSLSRYKSETINEILSHIATSFRSNKEDISHLREFFIQHIFSEHLKNYERLQLSLQSQLVQHREDVIRSLNNALSPASQNLEKLNYALTQQLNDMRTALDNTLSANLSKTTDIFTDIIKQLAHIDAAQKKISELSTNIVSLQDILTDKQCRGAFGEVQLETIIRNILPENHFEFQHILTNGKRADCVLILPQPTGKLVIDSKFPLESYRAIQESEKTINDNAKATAVKRFKQDIRYHIQAIAERYIIPNETSDCAIMFIPAESIFSEIHAHHPDIVQASYEAKIWMVSPTTMMAILNTANAIVKDISRQKEIHNIQIHINLLAKEFKKFHKRMDMLSKHIRLANDDAKDIHSSAKKIVEKFDQIERVELSSIQENEKPIDQLSLVKAGNQPNLYPIE